MNIMELFLVLIIILVILIAIVGLSIIRKLIKIILICMLVFIVFVVIAGLSIVNDLGSLGERLGSGNEIVLLSYGENIVAGFEKGKALDEKKLGENPSFYGKNKTIFIVKAALLSKINSTVNGKEVTGPELYSFFSENKEIKQVTIEDLHAEGISERSMRDALFIYIYGRHINATENPVFFFIEYRKGNIKVIPQTAFFRFAKIAPLSFLEEKINKLKEGIKDKNEVQDGISG